MARAKSLLAKEVELAIVNDAQPCPSGPSCSENMKYDSIERLNWKTGALLLSVPNAGHGLCWSVPKDKTFHKDSAKQEPDFQIVIQAY